MGLFTAVFLAVVLLCEGRIKKFQDEGTAASDEQMEGMPDYGNPEDARKLKCSACKNVVLEVKEALDKLEALRHGVVKSYEIEDVLDSLCSKISVTYGILRKSNRPTTIFSRNKLISRLTGNWINSYIETRCGEILTDYEDDLITNYRIPLQELQDKICRKGVQYCASTEEVQEAEL
eukprot:TRINITY_DN3623_c0_g1_i1.p1 TRINITY_DN3623_c0_g1~~TRINITY_DN3623_c0_g1_i1.p1  ORF type:complete len:190 (+),score=38.09 TRINITY_DN3623_c0_g1_i1:40-570(+)